MNYHKAGQELPIDRLWQEGSRIPYMKSKLLIFSGIVALLIIGFFAIKQINKGTEERMEKPTGVMLEDKGDLEKLEAETEVEFNEDGDVEGASIDKELDSLDKMLENASPEDFSEKNLSDL